MCVSLVDRAWCFRFDLRFSALKVAAWRFRVSQSDLDLGDWIASVVDSCIGEIIHRFEHNKKKQTTKEPDVAVKVGEQRNAISSLKYHYPKHHNKNLSFASKCVNTKINQNVTG